MIVLLTFFPESTFFLILSGNKRTSQSDWGIICPSFFTSVSPFHCCLGYQPPFFSWRPQYHLPKALSIVTRGHGNGLAPSCCTRWTFHCKANRHRSVAPRYCVGQRVMLLTHNISIKTMSTVINPCSVSLFYYCLCAVQTCPSMCPKSDD